MALELAQRVGGEIISADSMQVFRGLDIGTAKATGEERSRVRHHLLDVAAPDEPFDAARWLGLAKAAFDDIRGRGRAAIFCGGTGLYFSAWFKGLDAPAPADAALRAELESRPLEELLVELQARDPARFASIDRCNPRRVVRAVEIARFRATRPEPAILPPAAGATQSTIVVLERPTAELRVRIDVRVDRMFREGLVEETRALLDAGLGRERTALQAIGYRQVVEHLRGDRDLAATVALVKTKTWQFARRQMTWFRHQLPVTWLTIEGGEAPSATAERVFRAAMEGPMPAGCRRSGDPG